LLAAEPIQVRFRLKIIRYPAVERSPSEEIEIMRKSLAIGGALLALAAFISTADARMTGGGMSMSASMPHGASISSSMGSSRTFSADTRAFNAGNRYGGQDLTHGKGFKKPIDSDAGGDDPLPKPPKTPTPTSGGSDHPWLLPYYLNGGYGGGNRYGPPLACRGRPGGC
jgi:hypothetical protein